MLLSSFIASSLASQVKTQAQLTAQKSYFTELLLESSQKLQQGRNELECLQLAAEQLNRLFDRPVLYSLNHPDENLSFRVEPADEKRVLKQFDHRGNRRGKVGPENNKHAGATTNTLPDSKWLFLSVRGARGAMGLVGIPIAGYPIPDASEKIL